MNALAPTGPQDVRSVGGLARPRLAAHDPGVDPPLGSFGASHFSERRRVSLRWLAGTVMIGLSGGLLIGAAIYASLDRDGFFATAPEYAVEQAQEQDQSVNPQKGDRIVRPVDIVAARRSFWGMVTVREGHREVVRRQEFTRIDTPLAQASLGFADQVPPYNPIRLLAQPESVQPPPDPGEARDDAEVSFEMRDLASVDLSLSGPSLTVAEAAAQVAELQRASESGSQSPPIPPQLLLMRTSRAFVADPGGGLAFPGLQGGVNAAPFSSIQVRMVPENVTTVPETAAAQSQNEALVEVGQGETLADAIARAGVPRDQLQGLAAAFGFSGDRLPPMEGRRLKLQFLSGSKGAAKRLGRVEIYADEKMIAAAALDDSGHWLPVRQAPNLATLRSPSAHDVDHSIRLYDSLFQTALKASMPKSEIEELIRIFANDVDLQAPASAGDSIDILLRDGPSSSAGTIVYASLAAHGKILKYYRFREPGSKRVFYFDPEGRLREKFLVREPILNARLTSPFGFRFHPILGYSRMHTGVDWAAPIGTPVYAAGNGTVIMAGRESGYGNRVEIQHANGYVTTYNHLSGFARGVTTGAHVAQGQVIAYLGMTGLATGPHLHYEVIVNGRFVDPLKVKLTHTRELSGQALVEFQQDRKRIEALLADSARPAMIADSGR